MFSFFHKFRMPFPWNADIVIKCHSIELYEVFNTTTETCGCFWFNVIAKQTSTGNMEFFGLIGINENAVSNPLLPTVGRALLITVPRRRTRQETRFHYIQIPTRNIDNDNSIELLKYISPFHNVQWTSFGSGIWALRLLSPLDGILDPITTFTFPIFSSPCQTSLVNTIIQGKHHCIFEKCTTFWFCPENPYGRHQGDRNHIHCTIPDCPREFEIILNVFFESSS